MKKVILLLTLLPYMAAGQIFDNFENGLSDKWIQSPASRWASDSTGSLSGRFSLRQVYDNPEAGSDRIGIPVQNLHAGEGITRWSFRIRHGYDPSSTNNWSVFLMSDAPPSGMLPEGTVRGYAIGVNLTGYDDTLRLWKLSGSGAVTVVNCRINWQTEIGASSDALIEIERGTSGHWTVKVFRSNTSLIRSSEGNDSTIAATSWFGILYRYSSTRDRLLWVDDISFTGTFYSDTIPPSVKDYQVSGQKTLTIRLDEKPDSTFLNPENFSLNNPENKLVSVVSPGALEYILTFADSFINKETNKLTINKICDKYQNCRSNISLEFNTVWAETGDVIISEIMADPLPSVSLPGKEYLEITNRSGYSINLKNWRLSSEGQNVVFPEVLMLPLERRILCISQDTVLFSKYGKVTGLKQFPALTDGGKLIWLSDSLGILIHGVEYSSDWYGDLLKSGGGWSLEMKDINYPFYDSGNWIASSSRNGGSPGLINSVSSDNQDTSFYGIVNVFPEDSSSITLKISEPVINLSLKPEDVGIDEEIAVEIIPDDPLYRKFTVKTKVPLSGKDVHNFFCSGEIRDLAGNPIQKGNFKFGITEPAASNDILFNELLFNPFPCDPDYIEFYNRSDKIIDASRLQIVSVNDASGDPSQLINVSDEKRCILPKSYYVITTDREKITTRYKSGDPEHIFEISALPSMPDEGGHLILYNMELEKIDEVIFNDSLHHSSLSDNEGIALAKNNPENRSVETVNWNSEPESMGWGTPGTLNFETDMEAPVILESTVTGKNSVDIKLSEDPSADFLSTDNYLLNDELNKPISVIRETDLIFRVVFAGDFINKARNNLTLRALCDKSGNCTDSIKISFTPVWAETGDVIISEIMADPLPSVSLPGKEYLEITNRSGYSINLKNWRFLSEGQNVVFPEVLMLPLERRILCISQDTVLFSKYGKVTGLKQFPALTDGGKLIWLTDSLGTFIHGVEYSSDWYGDALKSGGGWSLEMKDINYPFYDTGNWTASSSRIGGSPGLINSVSSDNPDTSFYGIVNVFPEESSKISVKISEPVINLSSKLQEVGIDEEGAVEIIPDDPLYRKFTVKTKTPLSVKEIYNFFCSGEIRDFAGNPVQKRNFQFGITEPAASNDILFNELLFNPFPGDPDYIEFYNRSDKIIDASRLQLVSVNDASGEPSQLINVSDEKRCILPGSYYVITTDRKKIADRYKAGDPDHIFEISALPSMPDEGGHLILYNMELEKIDEVFFNDSLQHSSLSDNEGVALAKNQPENQSDETENWNSEPESMGWGTPGSLNFETDLEAPVIMESTVSGKNSVEIKLSEDPSADFLSTDNYLLNDELNKPVSVIRETDSIFRVVFACEFINKALNNLTIRSLCDKSGNCRDSIKISFTPVWAETGDIVITEIMADPDPAVSLPSSEYFEIRNRSSFSQSLKNWKLIAGEQVVDIPSVVMKPGEIRFFISYRDTTLYSNFGIVTGLRQFPSLTDEGKLLCLYDNSGMLIHGVEYSDKWYGSDLKSQGGWSLEIMDDSFPFHYEGNWKPSVSRKGGTPGTVNSVSSPNRDSYFYGIENIFPEDSRLITMHFPEPVKDYKNMNEAKIEGGPVIESISASDPLFREFSVSLSEDLVSQKLYKFELPEALTDFAGNMASVREFTFGLPEKPSAGDISFSELLFNPYPDDPDFIEFYNCSGKVIDASKLMLASINTATSDTSDPVRVSMTGRCILPGTYYAITTDRDKVTERYTSLYADRVFEVDALPSMPDDEGKIILLSNALEFIDEVSYNEEMHSSFLSGFEGISLEKADKCGSSGVPGNWRSASESSGWGTPGGPNSVFTETDNVAEIVSFSSTKITPDEDGFEDYLQIKFIPKTNETILSVNVYDESGNHVKKVAEHILAGGETTITWNGTADDGTPLPTGIYIILVSWYDETGSSAKIKRICSVIR